MLSFEHLPPWLNLVLFCAGAAAIWFSGTRLARYADAIAERTGIGRAFVGALLLGGITSLPEAATTLTASAAGSAALSMNNIFGGIAMQVAILAVVDAVVPGDALAGRIRQPSVLLQAALLILLLSLAGAAILTGDRAVLGVGLWSTVILFLSVFAFHLIHGHRMRETWEPETRRPRGEEPTANAEGSVANGTERLSLRPLLPRTALAAAGILVAGFVIARSGEAIADQTGLGESFVGFLFLAIATSLPEMSTTLAAARMGQLEMAFSNILGANILDTAIIFLADLTYGGGPILNELGEFSLFAVLLGVLVTSVYLVGLLDRRRRVFLGMGIDSVAVLIAYVGGLAFLYTIR